MAPSPLQGYPVGLERTFTVARVDHSVEIQVPENVDTSRDAEELHGGSAS